MGKLELHLFQQEWDKMIRSTTFLLILITKQPKPVPDANIVALLV